MEAIGGQVEQPLWNFYPPKNQVEGGEHQLTLRFQIYTGWIKKSGISGILADFGNFFSQSVLATNIIENFTIFEIFWL